MKRYFYYMIMAAALAGNAFAAEAVTPDGVRVDNVLMERNGQFIAISMDLDLKDVDVDANRALLITPCIVGADDDTECLPSVGIYGRRRYFYYLRTNGSDMLSGPEETTLRKRKLPRHLPYKTMVPYQPWMEGAQLSLQLQEYGCCNEVVAEDGQTLLADFRSIRDTVDNYLPALAYVKPQADSVKMRSLTGKAYIDFPVNGTEIQPDYRNNAAELQRITATIDSVKSDSDICITALSIKGYASPEGSYESNDLLAAGRTEALKEYVAGLFHFDKGFIRTDHEAEDWQGLRRYVEQSGLPHRQEILDIIDCDLQPDPKEWRLKSHYPEEYAILLHDCYPSLRHTDYSVEYEVRRYTSVEEIRRVLNTHPQKLSLEEFYLAAQAEEPGSEAFNEVFEVAVYMYPDDETANLNAANAALNRRDVERAERYLPKAGNSPQAIHARAVLALLKGEREQALRLFRQAAQQGVEEAQDALAHLEDNE